MNKQLVAVPGHRGHPPQPFQDERPVRRVGVLDRAALHLGVALITWGRRPVTVNRRQRLVASREATDVRRELDGLRDTYSLWGSDLLRLR
ncbi:MAG: hypothetical protein ABWY57_11760 [Mycetocola sp.]